MLWLNRKAKSGKDVQKHQWDCKEPNRWIFSLFLWNSSNLGPIDIFYLYEKLLTTCQWANRAFFAPLLSQSFFEASPRTVGPRRAGRSRVEGPTSAGPQLPQVSGKFNITTHSAITAAVALFRSTCPKHYPLSPLCSWHLLSASLKFCVPTGVATVATNISFYIRPCLEPFFSNCPTPTYFWPSMVRVL